LKNLTNIHSKLDRILDRLSALDTRVMTDTRRSDAQLRLMAQLVAEVQREAREHSLMTAEALKASRESAERTAQILAEMRKQ
jgi:hypothetical protein